jgi:hypothetical protein
MTIVAEKTGTVASLIDDLVTNLLGHTEWIDADTGFTNDQSTSNPEDNGRVLYYAPTDTFLAFVANRVMYDSNDWGIGVQITHAEDWDAGLHEPAAGRTNCSELGGHPFDSGTHAGTDIGGSFDYVSNGAHNNATMPGVSVLRGNNDGNPSDDRVDIANTPCNYFLSARPDGFTIGAWSSTDAEWGEAGWASFEQVDNKFWADSHLPTTLICRAASRGVNLNEYGWVAHRSNDDTGSLVLNEGGAIEDAEWGRLNPDVTDDTFFFRRPTIYIDELRNYPVAFVEDIVPNEINEGLAHGDDITHDGVTYRFLRQSGAGYDQLVSVGLRYE